jgi:tetratricopeptide (TPR) repeat protein
MRAITLLICILLTAAVDVASLAGQEPIFEGLGSYTRKITTSSVEAQKYFDQGLNFYFGFNHYEAIRSFQAAVAMDPDCAMAHWGIALSCGPHINYPVVPAAEATLAWRELSLAQKSVTKASSVEQMLVAALSSRYANPEPADRSRIDQAYADRMRDVWMAYPKDPDVGALFAESMLDLRPGDQWTKNGQAAPGTVEILGVLEAVLKVNLYHPFANHLYIHALEDSPHPEQALAAADRMRDLQPGVAHSVHMPSHIDIRLGHWNEAITANLKAVAADERYHEIAGQSQGLLALYAAHNQHMLAYAAMMTGRRDLAIEHIRTMAEGIPLEVVKEYPMFSQAFMVMPFEVYIRFGMWDEILAQPDYSEFMVFARAFRHAARGIAYAAKGDIESARAEQAVYLDTDKLVPVNDQFGSKYCESMLAIASPMLQGEILVREGKIDEGLTQLRYAVCVEDALPYQEPPGWILPVRHALGANLMQAGRYAEAEQVYREDLAQFPENGWSLYGLARSLRLQEKSKEASEIEARFHRCWVDADLKITSSCLCQPGMGEGGTE